MAMVEMDSTKATKICKKFRSWPRKRKYKKKGEFKRKRWMAKKAKKFQYLLNMWHILAFCNECYYWQNDRCSRSISSRKLCIKLKFSDGGCG